MPPSHGQHPRFRVRTGARAALRTASPAVEIIARRLLSKGKSIVPPELLSRSQKKKRESGGRAGLLSPSGVPKRNIEDSIKKLSKVAGRIGYYTIKQEAGENYENLQVRWSNFRKTVKTCTSIEDLRERLLGIATKIDERFLRPEWKNESKNEWMTSCRNAKSNPDIQACLREFETDAIHWEKVEYVHELMDISNQIPTSQVKNTDPKFWFEEFPSKLRDSAGPQDMAKHLKEICMQLRPGAEIVDKDWMQEKRSEWLRRCAVCDNWSEFRQLMTSFDEDAVDWKNASKIMRKENEGKDTTEDSKAENSKLMRTPKSRKSDEEVMPADSSNGSTAGRKEKHKIVKSKNRSTKPLKEANDSDEDKNSSEVDSAVQEDQTEPTLEQKVKHPHNKRPKSIEDSGQGGQRKKAKNIISVADKVKMIQSAAKDSLCGENSSENSSSHPNPIISTNSAVLAHLAPSEESSVLDLLARTPASGAGITAGSLMEADGSSSLPGRNPGADPSSSNRVSAHASAGTAAVCSNARNITDASAEAVKKPKIPRQRSKVSIKAKPAKIAAGLQPRTGLGEQFDQVTDLSTRDSQEEQERVIGRGVGCSLPLGQAHAPVTAGPNAARGVWDGAAHGSLALRNEVSNIGNVGGAHYAPNAGMYHSGGGQGMGSMRPMAEGGLGQYAGLSGDSDGRGTGMTQRGGGSAGYMDALELGLDAPAFRSAGAGVIGHAANLGAGMLLQGVGMQAQVQGQVNGRGFQTLGVGLGMKQQGSRVGFGMQPEMYNVSSLGDAGGYGWGGQNWGYLGQSAANMRMMQPYEDAAAVANLRMLQQLHNASMGSGLVDGRAGGASLAGLGLAGSAGSAGGGGGGGGPSFPTPAYPIPKYPQPRQDAFSAFQGPGSKQAATNSSAGGRPIDPWPHQVPHGAAYPASVAASLSAAAGPGSGTARRSAGRGGGAGGYETESDSDKEAEDESGQAAAAAPSVSCGAGSISGDAASASGADSGVQGSEKAAATAGSSQGAEAQLDGTGARSQPSVAGEVQPGDAAAVAVEARAYPVEGGQSVEEAVGLVQAYPVRVEDDSRAAGKTGQRGAAGEGSCGIDDGGLDQWAQKSAGAVERVRGQEVALRNEYTAFLDTWRCVQMPNVLEHGNGIIVLSESANV